MRECVGVDGGDGEVEEEEEESLVGGGEILHGGRSQQML